jgi:anti-sigma B factor antagonist
MTFLLREQAVGPGEHRIAVTGDLDLATSPALERWAARAIDDGATKLVIDLAETTFIDSTAIRVILAIRERIREAGGEIVIECERENVLNVFRITGLDEELTIRPPA